MPRGVRPSDLRIAQRHPGQPRAIHHPTGQRRFRKRGRPGRDSINPNNVSDIWIVDNGTDNVYQYVGAASRTSGSQNAGATFALAAGNTNPQGIADPPTADMLLTPATERSPSNGRGMTAPSSTSVPSNGSPSSGNPMS